MIIMADKIIKPLMEMYLKGEDAGSDEIAINTVTEVKKRPERHKCPYCGCH